MSVPTINAKAAALLAKLTPDVSIILENLDPIPLPSDKAPRTEDAKAAGKTADPATPQKPAAPLPAQMVEAARHVAASRQASVAPLLADLEQAIRNEALPPPVKAAAREVLRLQTPVEARVTPQVIKDAFSRSGLFLEPRLAKAPAAPPGPDLKTALLVLRQVLRAAAPPAPETAAAPSTPQPTSQPATPQPLAAAYSPPRTALPTFEAPLAPQAPPAPQAPEPPKPQGLPAQAAPAANPAPTNQAAPPASPQAAAPSPQPPPPTGSVPLPVQSPPAGTIPVPAPPQAVQAPTPSLAASPQQAAPTPIAPTAPQPPKAPTQQAVPSGQPLPAPDIEPPVDPDAPLPVAQRAERSDAPRQAAPAETPAPPMKGAPPEAQKAAAPTLPPESDPAAVLRHLEKATSGAIARTELMQLASLPDAPRADGDVSMRAQSWLFEVPLATPQGPAIAQFEIEKDGSNGEALREAPAWRTRFSVDVEPLGLIHALLVLAGRKTTVTLWAERSWALARLRAKQAELAGSLEAEVAVHPGRPAAPKLPQGRFLDASS